MTWQYSCAVGHHSHRWVAPCFIILQRNKISFAIVFSSWLRRESQSNIFNDLQNRKNWPIFCAVRQIYVLFGLYEAILRSYTLRFSFQGAVVPKFSPERRQNRKISHLLAILGAFRAILESRALRK